MSRDLDFFPEELEGLDAMLSDTYFCNFSLFQRMPDSWAIKQLFPSFRFTGSNEKPIAPWRVLATSRAIRRQSGPVHRPAGCEADVAPARFNGGDITIGSFLVGAYQEILGDLHNSSGIQRGNTCG